MRSRHLVYCGTRRAPKAPLGWDDAAALALCLGEGTRDVHLRIDQLSAAMTANLPPIAVDLLEVASYVCTADHATSRGGKAESSIINRLFG